MSQAVAKPSFKSPMYEMTQSTPTCLWNDSAATAELLYSIDHGAVGATCNPVIVLGVLKQEMDRWAPMLRQLIDEHPRASEDELGWMLVEEVSKAAASLLAPIFAAQGGRNGRLSIQTDPRLYRNSAAMVDQAVRFSHLAPNMIVKIPVSRAGVVAIEEATYRGVSINATVSFSLPQAIAVAEAVERGVARREAEGLEVASIAPVCTIMVGRLDDWLKAVAERQGIIVDPGCLEWAGVAVFKKTYALYRERGYRTRLLSAAFRNHMHWSELVGGDVVVSPPYSWQVRFNESDVTVEDRISRPVDQKVLDALEGHFVDFRRASTEGGLGVEDFDSFGPNRRTLRQFIAACSELDAWVRDFLTPDPAEC